MQSVNIFRRANCSDSDYVTTADYKEVEVATVRLTTPKIITRGNKHDVGAAFTQWFRVPRGIDTHELAHAILYTMSGSNCAHSYDCCGCAHRQIGVKIVSPRRMVIHTQVYYNY